MFFDFFKKKPKVEPVAEPIAEPLATPVVAPESVESEINAAAPPVSPVQVEAPAIDEAPASSMSEVATAEAPVETEAVEAAPVESAPADEIAIAEDKIVEPVVDVQIAETEAVLPEVVVPDAAVSEIAEQQMVEHQMVDQQAVDPLIDAPAVAQPEPKLGFFARIKQGLARTSSHFAEGLGNLFLGRKTIDDELFEDLETQLLVADVGMEATTAIIDKLTARVARKQLNDGDALYAALREELTALLRPVEQPLVIPARDEPYVILVVGVNGVGKTTTIGKLAKRFQREGKKVMLAAGDTFRAAAVEQLQVWGERNQVPVIAQHTGADSASVIFDAMQAAKSRKIDVIIADTAGRLHNKGHLMEELAKVKRVMAKSDVTAPHEVLLVLDAGTGQNALNQADHFRDAAGVTGLALTKLDGTAKGGVIFALSQKFGLPVRFIGVGEGIDDLQPFAAESFVSALFDKKID